MNSQIAQKYFLIIFILTSMLIAGNVLADVTAIISDISAEGKAFVKKIHSKEWQPVKKGLYLKDGDTIKTGDNTSLVILYQSGSAKQIYSNEQFTISDPVEESTLFSELSKSINNFLFGEKHMPTPGVSRGLDEPILLYPRVGKLLTACPDFAWMSLGNDITYQIRLEKSYSNQCDEKVPEKTMWKLTTQDTLFHFPESEPNLVAGNEYWVELVNTDKRYYRYISDCVTIVSEEERNDILDKLDTIKKQYSSNDTTDITATAVSSAYLMDCEYYTEAYKQLQIAHIKHPGHPLIDSLRVNLFTLTDLAELIVQIRAQKQVIKGAVDVK